MRLDKVTFNLSNPVLVFSSIWGLDLLLMRARLLTHIGELQFNTYLLILGNVVSFIAIYAFLATGHHPKKIVSTLELEKPELLDKLRAYSHKLLVLWTVGTLINIVYSDGFPFWWLLTGAAKTYVDFGIPSVSGFLNALYMFSLSALFLVYCIRKQKKVLFLVLALLIWQVMVISRGALTWTLLQMLGVYLLIHRISMRRFIQVAACVLAFIIVFGVVGDMRLGINKDWIRSYVSDEYRGVMDLLPSGFLWIYTYITGGINNVNAVINDLQPTYIFYHSTVNLFPTFIRGMIYEPGKYPIELLVSALNVSSFYVGILADFGMFGALIFVSFLQLGVSLLYFAARRGKIWAILASAVMFQCLVLSIFVDTFTSLVTIAQILLALNFKRLCAKSAGPRRTIAPRKAGFAANA